MPRKRRLRAAGATPANSRRGNDDLVASFCTLGSRFIVDSSPVGSSSRYNNPRSSIHIPSRTRNSNRRRKSFAALTDNARQGELKVFFQTLRELRQENVKGSLTCRNPSEHPSSDDEDVSGSLQSSSGDRLLDRMESRPSDGQSDEPSEDGMLRLSFLPKRTAEDPSLTIPKLPLFGSASESRHNNSYYLSGPVYKEETVEQAIDLFVAKQPNRVSSNNAAYSRKSSSPPARQASNALIIDGLRRTATFKRSSPAICTPSYKQNRRKWCDSTDSGCDNTPAGARSLGTPFARRPYSPPCRFRNKVIDNISPSSSDSSLENNSTRSSQLLQLFSLRSSSSSIMSGGSPESAAMLSDCLFTIDEDIKQEEFVKEQSPASSDLIAGQEPFLTARESSGVDNTPAGENVRCINAMGNPIVWGALAGDSPRRVAVGTATDSSPRRIIFGTSMGDSPRRVIFGTAMDSSPRKMIFSTPMGDSPRRVMFGTTTDNSPRRFAVGTTAALNRSPRRVALGTAVDISPRRVVFGSPTDNSPRMAIGTSDSPRVALDNHPMAIPMATTTRTPTATTIIDSTPGPYIDDSLDGLLSPECPMPHKRRVSLIDTFEQDFPKPLKKLNPNGRRRRQISVILRSKPLVTSVLRSCFFLCLDQKKVDPVLPQSKTVAFGDVVVNKVERKRVRPIHDVKFSLPGEPGSPIDNVQEQNLLDQEECFWTPQLLEHIKNECSILVPQSKDLQRSLYLLVRSLDVACWSQEVNNEEVIIHRATIEAQTKLLNKTDEETDGPELSDLLQTIVSEKLKSVLQQIERVVNVAWSPLQLINMSKLLFTNLEDTSSDTASSPSSYYRKESFGTTYSGGGSPSAVRHQTSFNTSSPSNYSICRGFTEEDLIRQSMLHTVDGVYVYRIDDFSEFYLMGPTLGEGGEGTVALCLPRQVADLLKLDPTDLDLDAMRKKRREQLIKKVKPAARLTFNGLGLDDYDDYDDDDDDDYNYYSENNEEITRITPILQFRPELREFAFAVKITIKNDETAKKMCQMAPALAKLRHPNVLAHRALYEDDYSFYHVMDLADGPELLDYLSRSADVSQEQCRELAKQLLSALEYIHRQGLIHRDVKPENFVCRHPLDLDGEDPIGVSPSGSTRKCVTFTQAAEELGTVPNILLLDFGLACYKNEASMTEPNGTSAYMAPELLKDVRPPYHYDEKVDIWAAGVLLCMMLTGTAPFGDEGPPDEPIKVTEGPEWSHVPLEAKELVNHLLAYDPDERWSAEQALSHPWFMDSPMSGSSSYSSDDESSSIEESSCWEESSTKRQHVLPGTVHVKWKLLYDATIKRRNKIIH